jgi:hypothetical protein
VSLSPGLLRARGVLAKTLEAVPPCASAGSQPDGLTRVSPGRRGGVDAGAGRSAPRRGGGLALGPHGHAGDSGQQPPGPTYPGARRGGKGRAPARPSLKQAWAVSTRAAANQKVARGPLPARTPPCTPPCAPSPGRPRAPPAGHTASQPAGSAGSQRLQGHLRPAYLAEAEGKLLSLQ